MKIKLCRAQSTVEYLLVLTAVLLVIIATVATPSSPFRQGLNNIFSGFQDWFSQGVDYRVP